MSSSRSPLIRREQVTWTQGDVYRVQHAPAAEAALEAPPPPAGAPSSPAAFEPFYLPTSPASAPARPAEPPTPAAAPHPMEAEAAHQAILGAAVAQAQQILQNARQQAAELMQSAEAQVTEASRQAREEARKEIEAETGHLLLTAQGVLDEVRAWRDSYLRQSERPVLDLLLRIGRQIFGHGLTLDQPTLHSAFERALAEAKPLGHLRIHVHPDDAALLDPHWPEQQAARLNQHLELVPDPNLRRGGCLVEGEYGAVDARVETQLRLAQEALEAVAPDAPASQS